MDTPNDTATFANTQQLVVEIILSSPAGLQQILVPVADTGAGLKLMLDIRKTPGFYLIGADSEAPEMFHVRNVFRVHLAVLPPQTRVAPTSGKIATLRQ